MFNNDIPQLIDPNGGSYSSIAPKLGKLTKWKKRMKCFLHGMEPYMIKYL